MILIDVFFLIVRRVTFPTVLYCLGLFVLVFGFAEFIDVRIALFAASVVPMALAIRWIEAPLLRFFPMSRSDRYFLNALVLLGSPIGLMVSLALAAELIRLSFGSLAPLHDEAPRQLFKFWLNALGKLYCFGAAYRLLRWARFTVPLSLQSLCRPLLWLALAQWCSVILNHRDLAPGTFLAAGAAGSLFLVFVPHHNHRCPERDDRQWLFFPEVSASWAGAILTGIIRSVLAMLFALAFLSVFPERMRSYQGFEFVPVITCLMFGANYSDLRFWKHLPMKKSVFFFYSFALPLINIAILESLGLAAEIFSWSYIPSVVWLTSIAYSRFLASRWLVLEGWVARLFLFLPVYWYIQRNRLVQSNLTSADLLLSAVGFAILAVAAVLYWRQLGNPSAYRRSPEAFQPARV